MIREALKATGTARRVALAILSASLLISGCGSGAESITADGQAGRAVTAAAPQGGPAAPPTTTLWGQGASGTMLAGGEELLGGPGEMIPVTNADLTLHGYQKPSDVFGSPGNPPQKVTPIYDDHGVVIGYMGQLVGWITLAEHDAAGFSYEAALAEYRQRFASRTGCPVTTLEDCLVARNGLPAEVSPDR